MSEKTLKVILATLGAYRATNMVLFEDGPADIFQRLRNLIYSNFQEGHWVYRGFNCPYCVSFWLALGLLIAPGFVREWLAVAAGAQWLIKKDFESIK